MLRAKDYIKAVQLENTFSIPPEITLWFLEFGNFIRGITHEYPVTVSLILLMVIFGDSLVNLKKKIASKIKERNT